MTGNDRVTVRAADPGDAKALHAMLASKLADGDLLARRLDEITVDAACGIVAVCRRKIIGGAELVPLSSQLAAVRSLVVDANAGGQRRGALIVSEIHLRARPAGYQRLCVPTHAPEDVFDFGFSSVPQLWVEKTPEPRDHAEAAGVLHCA
jgi:N-acetylglutamate synthase-like GNAT family acetyltransferase